MSCKKQCQPQRPKIKAVTNINITFRCNQGTPKETKKSTAENLENSPSCAPQQLVPGPITHWPTSGKKGAIVFFAAGVVT